MVPTPAGHAAEPVKTPSTTSPTMKTAITPLLNPSADKESTATKPLPACRRKKRGSACCCINPATGLNEVCRFQRVEPKPAALPSLVRSLASHTDARTPLQLLSFMNTNFYTDVKVIHTTPHVRSSHRVDAISRNAQCSYSCIKAEVL